MRSWGDQLTEIDARISDLRRDELVQYHRLDVAISDEIAAHHQVQRSQRDQAAARAAIDNDEQEIDALLEERAGLVPEQAVSSD